VIEELKCCAEVPIEPIACCGQEPSTESATKLSFCSHCCDRTVVAKELTSATLPADHSQDVKLKNNAALTASQGPMNDMPTESRGHHDQGRGPARPPPEPIFLLNSSFLI
jgi:hypothetical protein